MEKSVHKRYHADLTAKWLRWNLSEFINMPHDFTLTIFRLGGDCTMCDPHRFLPGCAKTAYSRLMILSDFQYNFIGHHLKYFSVYNNQGCCHGNTFVKSGSLVKNDQNQ